MTNLAFFITYADNHDDAVDIAKEYITLSKKFLPFDWAEPFAVRAKDDNELKIIDEFLYKDYPSKFSDEEIKNMYKEQFENRSISMILDYEGDVQLLKKTFDSIVKHLVLESSSKDIWDMHNDTEKRKMRDANVLMRRFSYLLQAEDLAKMNYNFWRCAYANLITPLGLINKAFWESNVTGDKRYLVAIEVRS